MPTPKNIELIARGFILHQSHVLMCRSIPGNYFYLPGGHIEFAEPASTALEREFIEETATKITVGPLLLTAENTFNDGQADHHEVTLLFHVEQLAGRDLATIDAAPEIESQESHIEFIWVDLASATDLDIRPLQIKAWLVSGGNGGDGAGAAAARHLGGFEIAIPQVANPAAD